MPPEGGLNFEEGGQTSIYWKDINDYGLRSNFFFHRVLDMSDKEEQFMQVTGKSRMEARYFLEKAKGDIQVFSRFLSVSTS